MWWTEKKQTNKFSLLLSNEPTVVLYVRIVAFNILLSQRKWPLAEFSPRKNVRRNL
jgi:hypothetical protein